MREISWPSGPPLQGGEVKICFPVYVLPDYVYVSAKVNLAANKRA